MNTIDRLNLEEACRRFPNYAIRFDNEFLGGTDKKPFGCVPNEWNGKTLYFYYAKDKLRKESFITFAQFNHVHDFSNAISKSIIASSVSLSNPSGM